MLLFFLLNTTIPIDSPLNTVIYYLQTRGFARIQTIKPFEIDDIVPEIDTLVFLDEKLNPIDRNFVSLFSPLLVKSNDFYTVINVDAENQNFKDFYGNLNLQLSGRITNHISFGEAIRFHFGTQIDSTGPKPWKDIVQAYLNEGFLKVANKNAEFILGRRNLLIGFGDAYSLILSPAKQGYDGFLLTYDGRYYEFSSTFSVLDIKKLRFISTHRLGLNLHNFKLGFCESILWVDELEPLYLNFFLPYYLSQWGIDRNDNIMWCLDGSFNISNTTVFGEFLIDDYQFSEPPPGYTEYPHKLGFQCGIKNIMFEKLFFDLGYTFVDKWVYTHQIPENIYENDSLCLGFPLGNDVDQVTCAVRFFNRTKIFPKMRFEFTRKGQGSLFLPYETERGPAYPEFPSGIVEKSITITPGIEFYVSPRFFLNIEAGKKFINNFGHIPNSDKNENIINLWLWFMF
ncbi:MAG: hypothetical protein ACPL28_10380 [bacterium]